MCGFYLPQNLKFFAQLCQMIHILSAGEGWKREVMVTNLLLLMLQKQKSRSAAERERGNFWVAFFYLWFLHMRANLAGDGVQCCWSL